MNEIPPVGVKNIPSWGMGANAKYLIRSWDGEQLKIKRIKEWLFLI